jgi:MATE family multidrug resistance protein
MLYSELLMNLKFNHNYYYMKKYHTITTNIIMKIDKCIEKDNEYHTEVTPISNGDSTIKAALQVLFDAIPATIGLLFIFIAETINIIFIGRFNQPEMIAGIGIGTLYINATGYVLGAGLMGGLDTLCSQAFGNRKYKMVGVYANVARICIGFYFIFISLPFTIFSKPMLLMIGQEDAVAQFASRFCHSMLPSLFFALQYNTTLRYLQAMNVFKPGMFITFFTVLLHPLWCYLFIYVFDHNVVGAGIAMSITQLLNWISIQVYIHICNPYPESYFFTSREMLKYAFFVEYLKKAVPAAILFAADWIGFEILTLMSSYLSNLSLAANVCFLNFITIIFMISMGLSFASTTLVGNSIGAYDVKRAKLYTIAALIADIVIFSILTLLVLIFRQYIPYVYTSDEKIVRLVEQLLNIYLCFSIIDSVQVVLHGVIKGLGKQTVASIIALIILYPINISLAYSLAFIWGYGLIGLWYSQMISIFLLFIGFSAIVILSDWEKIAVKTRRRLEEENMLLQETHKKE